MSKKKLLLICALIIIVAVGLYYRVSVLDAIQRLTRNPTEALSNVLTFIREHLQALIGTISGIFGTLTFAAYRLTQHKQQTEDSIKALQTESSNTINELTTQKDLAEETLRKTTLQYSDNFKEMSANFVDVQNQLQDITAKNEQLTKQLEDERAYYRSEIKRLEAEKVAATRVA